MQDCRRKKKMPQLVETSKRRQYNQLTHLEIIKYLEELRCALAKPRQLPGMNLHHVWISRSKVARLAGPGYTLHTGTKWENFETLPWDSWKNWILVTIQQVGLLQDSISIWTSSTVFTRWDHHFTRIKSGLTKFDQVFTRDATLADWGNAKNIVLLDFDKIRDKASVLPTSHNY